MHLAERFELTRLCDASADGTALKGGARQIQGLLQTLNGLELNVAETLRGLGHLVLHNSDIGDTTSREKIGDIIGGSIEGKVADVAGERRLGGKVEGLANGISTALNTV